MLFDEGDGGSLSLSIGLTALDPHGMLALRASLQEVPHKCAVSWPLTDILIVQSPAERVCLGFRCAKGIGVELHIFIF